MSPARSMQAVVMGASAGGWAAFSRILTALPADYALPVAIVLHVHPGQGEDFPLHMAPGRRIPVRPAQDKDPFLPGVAHFAPPDYHLLIEWDKTLSLSADPKVCHSRPSIDVLFESAASVYGPGLLGVLLTGASSDGTNGIKRINELGGLTVVQDPDTAEHPTMPRSAVTHASPWRVLGLDAIAQLLLDLAPKPHPVFPDLESGATPPDRSRP
ncbi:chemotaxis protein CheB [Fundidesulfovibrio agrisoli]|uniref:chemotaxis protein CheB n=1 Tax=Fundidesulfovibrio agrisoli TaxID=2922717 RepID=UPI001FAE16D1|nr:chemotaxis protein CheB [Fundidesulfovibrio agrisoli]